MKNQDISINWFSHQSSIKQKYDIYIYRIISHQTKVSGHFLLRESFPNGCPSPWDFQWLVGSDVFAIEMFVPFLWDMLVFWGRTPSSKSPPSNKQQRNNPLVFQCIPTVRCLVNHFPVWSTLEFSSSDVTVCLGRNFATICPWQQYEWLPVFKSLSAGLILSFTYWFYSSFHQYLEQKTSINKNSFLGLLIMNPQQKTKVIETRRQRTFPSRGVWLHSCLNKRKKYHVPSHTHIHSVYHYTSSQNAWRLLLRIKQ